MNAVSAVALGMLDVQGAKKFAKSLDPTPLFVLYKLCNYAYNVISGSSRGLY